MKVNPTFFASTFFLMLAVIVTAQVATSFKELKLDSLEKTNLSYQHQDERKLTLLNQLTFSYQYLDPKKGIHSGEQAIELAKKLNNSFLLAEAYHNLGLNYFIKSEYVQAKELYEKALAINQRLNNSFGVALNTYQIGNIYREKGENNKALELFEKSLELLGETKTSIEVSHVYDEISFVSKSLSEIPRVLEYYQLPLITDDLWTTEAGMIKYHSFMGSAFYYLADYSKALEFFQKAADLGVQLNDQCEIANNLSNIGHVYLTLSDHITALGYFQKAIEINKQINETSSLPHNLHFMGVCYLYLSNYPKALELYNEALAISEIVGDKKSMVSLLNSIGYVYSDQSDYGIYGGDLSDYSRALVSFQKAFEIAAHSGDKNLLASSFRNMGSIYSTILDYAKALDYYQKSFDLFEQLGLKNRMAISLFSIGHNYIKLTEYAKGMEICEQALRMNEELGNKVAMAISYNNMGDIHFSMANYDKALDYYQKGFDVCEQMGDKKFMALNLNGIGNCYIKLSDFFNAFEVCQKAVILNEQLGNKNGLASNFLNMGQVFWRAPDAVFQKLGIKLDDRLKLAIRQVNHSLDISKEIGSLALQKNAWQLLNLIYEDQKNDASAFIAYKNFIALRDSIQGHEAKNLFIRKEIQYEFDKKESELKFQQQLTSEQLQKQQLLNRQERVIYLLAGIAILGIAGLLAMRQWYARKKHQLEVDRLQDLDKFKNKLYTNITHEFRTPLTVISGVASELKNRKEMFDSGVSIIQRNSSRLLHLVNQMMDLSKLQSGTLSIHLVNGDIVQYMGYVVQSFQSFAASKQIQLHFLPEMLIFSMDYDAEKTMQILSNLISNAIKFTTSGGNIYVHLARREHNGLEQIQFKVQDTGIGIAAEKLPHIFDRFYQIEDGHRADKGTGIGLALVKELVQLLGGSIIVQSSPDKGSVFVVTLPVTQVSLDEPVEYQPASVREAVASFAPMLMNGIQTQDDAIDISETPRLLILEDTPDVIHYLRMCLDKDYRITEAHDGGAGIDMAIDTVPDIIITDVMMPVKDGYEVCRTLKEDERTSHIPIIMLTARADTSSKLEGLETGADAYLYKPFEKDELQIRLRKLLELRVRLQRHYTNGESIQSLASEGMEKEDQFIQKLKEIIHAHLDDEDFGIVELCGVMHLSRTQLHYKIKALTGRSTSLYIRLIRLQEAKTLLKETKMHISEVAYATGFRDPAYFTRCFVEDFGLNPSEFRHGRA